MRDIIVEKLKAVCDKEQYSEEDVVYFLVECFKVLEQSKRTKQFNVIRFYRNWSCHSSLSKDAENIFEEIYIIIRAKKYLNLDDDSEDGWPPFAELIDNTVTSSFEEYSFKKLRKEIEKFSNDFMADKVPNWANFQEQLRKVITDTPLIIKKGENEIFRFEVYLQQGAAPFNGLAVSVSYPSGWIRGGGSRFFEFE